MATNSGILPNIIPKHILSLQNSVRPPTPTTTPQSNSRIFPNLNSEPISVSTLISPYFGVRLVDIPRDTSELDLEKYPMPVVIILLAPLFGYYCCCSYPLFYLPLLLFVYSSRLILAEVLSYSFRTSC